MRYFFAFLLNVLAHCLSGLGAMIWQKRLPMASNFIFFSHETRNSLHLKLFGDFDGSSALELIEALKKIPDKSFQIFIDTEDLKTISSFGKNVFQKNLTIETKRLNGLIFIGKHKYELTL